MRHELAGTVGRIIARYRAAAGMTQEQLSLALDVDPVTISRFERGASLPSLITVQKLCDIFDISLGQFFSGTGEPNTSRSESTALLVMFDSLPGEERKFMVDTLKRFCRLVAKQRRE